MYRVSHRSIPVIWLAIAGLAFVLGLTLNPGEATRADARRDGFQNRVLEVTASGAGLKVRAAPSQAADIIDTLYWGDRVLWMGDSTEAEGSEWLNVGSGSGLTGWIVNVDGWTIEMDPVYTTPGTGLGAQVRVTEMGDSSHCREEPSSLSTEAQTMQAGTQAVVVGGPYQAEYWIWWQYELPNGHRCWIVDIPGWFEVTAPRTP